MFSSVWRFAQVSAFLSLVSLAHADVTIEHSQGNTQVKTPLNNVLTYDLATLDTLDTLGIKVTGLPQAVLPERLKKYSSDEYINIGSLFEPDYEIVASLQPDLIVVANRSSKAYKDLSALAPTIDLTVWGDGFIDQFKSVTRTLGELFDKSEIVEQRLEALDQNIAITKERAKASGKSLIIMTNGGKLSAYGEGSRFGWLHTELGFEPAVAEFKKGPHGDPISFEYLLDVDPDVIFVVDRDGAIDVSNGAAKATLDNDLVKRTKAYKNNRIIYLDSSNWYVVVSGLSTVEQMVAEVAKGVSN